jgi:hypothetical protein
MSSFGSMTTFSTSPSVDDTVLEHERAYGRKRSSDALV